MDFVCPSCQSDNIQRLSVIFEGGLSDINTAICILRLKRPDFSVQTA